MLHWSLCSFIASERAVTPHSSEIIFPRRRVLIDTLRVRHIEVVELEILKFCFVRWNPVVQIGLDVNEGHSVEWYEPRWCLPDYFHYQIRFLTRHRCNVTYS